MQHLPHPKNKEGLYICQLCFEEFESLTSHIRHHNLKAWEYLAEIGMSPYTEINSKVQRDNVREANKNSTYCRGTNLCLKKVVNYI